MQACAYHDTVIHRVTKRYDIPTILSIYQAAIADLMFSLVAVRGTQSVYRSHKSARNSSVTL